ncbi:hypothetical protein F0U60_06225 [Archangium minus]|uniref:Uncharacterized protein n=1 Tax=Archangium minus TaxID=83450 RepID=A0ABY9WIW3_9BACT|nr:hypothetical protein F0U60_06225 [Archangium minus]
MSFYDKRVTQGCFPQALLFSLYELITRTGDVPPGGQAPWKHGIRKVFCTQKAAVQGGAISAASAWNTVASFTPLLGLNRTALPNLPGTQQ